MTAIRDRVDRDARQARFVTELEEWVEAEKSRRKQVAIPRKGLQGFDRLRAQRNALLEGLAKSITSTLGLTLPQDCTA